jgi:general secretion pathway protein M
MIAIRLFERISLPYPVIPALGYGALLIMLLASALFAITGVVERRHTLMASTEILTRFEHPQSSSRLENGQVVGDVPAGSPFLEGQTETIASAVLLQRVASAITRVGGNVISSEVEPQDKQSPDRLVRITTTSELEQRSLQPLLYDIEAGMPFLFVNKLTAQAPASGGDNGRLRVVLEVSGVWLGENSK